MTEFIRFGEHQQISPEGVPGYSDARGYFSLFRDINSFWEKRTGEPFSMTSFLQGVAEEFPGERLHILEGGTGKGFLLSDISGVANNIELPVKTIGVDFNTTLFPKDEPINGLDQVFLGDLQNIGDRIPDESIHLAIDNRGPYLYDYASKIGATVMPIYSRLLKPGGKMILFSWDFTPGSANKHSAYSGRFGGILHQELRDVIHDNGLKIEKTLNNFGILTKPK